MCLLCLSSLFFSGEGGEMPWCPNTCRAGRAEDSAPASARNAGTAHGSSFSTEPRAAAWAAGRWLWCSKIVHGHGSEGKRKTIIMSYQKKTFCTIKRNWAFHGHEPLKMCRSIAFSLQQQNNHYPPKRHTHMAVDVKTMYPKMAPW